VDTPIGVDCPGIACGDQAVFNMPGYLARFVEAGRTVDLNARLGSVGGSLRAERLGGGRIPISAVTGARRGA
jgi:hypothetical protein